MRSVDSNEVETLRFPRALFGLGPSPFLLGGVIEQHLAGWSEKLPESVAEISRSLYVHDQISGAYNVTKAQDLKSDATKVFADASFELHKWHSNEPELEDHCQKPEIVEETTYAKQQLVFTAKECKLLGLAWNKDEDTVSVVFPDKRANPTRGPGEIIPCLRSPWAGIADDSSRKLIFREACESNTPWDAALPEKLAKLWEK